MDMLSSDLLRKFESLDSDHKWIFDPVKHTYEMMTDTVETVEDIAALEMYGDMIEEHLEHNFKVLSAIRKRMTILCVGGSRPRTSIPRESYPDALVLLEEGMEVEDDEELVSNAGETLPDALVLLEDVEEAMDGVVDEELVGNAGELEDDWGGGQQVHHSPEKEDGDLKCTRTQQKGCYAEKATQRRWPVAECAVLQLLTHRNVVRVWGATEAPGRVLRMSWWMENLKDFVEKNGTRAESSARLLTTNVLRGLAYLHSFGLVHRNIKPSNILLDVHRNAALGDFERSHNEVHPTMGSVSLDLKHVAHCLIYMITRTYPADPCNLDAEVKMSVSREAQEFVVACCAVGEPANTACYRLLRHPYLSGVTNSEEVRMEKFGAGGAVIGPRSLLGRVKEDVEEVVSRGNSAASNNSLEEQLRRMCEECCVIRERKSHASKEVRGSLRATTSGEIPAGFLNELVAAIRSVEGGELYCIARGGTPLHRLGQDDDDKHKLQSEILQTIEGLVDGQDGGTQLLEEVEGLTDRNRAEITTELKRSIKELYPSLVASKKYCAALDLEMEKRNLRPCKQASGQYRPLLRCTDPSKLTDADLLRKYTEVAACVAALECKYKELGRTICESLGQQLNECNRCALPLKQNTARSPLPCCERHLCSFCAIEEARKSGSRACPLCKKELPMMALLGCVLKDIEEKWKKKCPEVVAAIEKLFTTVDTALQRAVQERMELFCDHVAFRFSDYGFSCEADALGALGLCLQDIASAACVSRVLDDPSLSLLCVRRIEAPKYYVDGQDPDTATNILRERAKGVYRAILHQGKARGLSHLCLEPPALFTSVSSLPKDTKGMQECALRAPLEALAEDEWPFECVYLCVPEKCDADSFAKELIDAGVPPRCTVAVTSCRPENLAIELCKRNHDVGLMVLCSVSAILLNCSPEA